MDSRIRFKIRSDSNVKFVKIAVFSDIHGNYLNLLSFFKSVDQLGVHQYICLGDLCNYYPDNLKVIEFIRSKNITCLLGNHDELYVSDNNLSKEKKITYNFDENLQLNNDCIKYFKSLPLSHEIKVNNKLLFFCHASPYDLINTYVYPDTDLDIYNEVPYDYVFIGHTHRQFIKKHNQKIFCNVGSIGMPRDNGSLMSFAVIDTADLSIKLYRKLIDVNAIKLNYMHNTPKEVIELLDRKEEINFEYIEI